MSEQVIIFIFFFIVLFAGVLRGLKSGSMVLLLHAYKRSEDPGVYWASIAVAGANAVALLAVLVLG